MSTPGGSSSELRDWPFQVSICNQLTDTTSLGGEAALIKVLQDGPEDAKQNAAAALGSIAQHDQSVDAHQQGAVSPLCPGGVPQSDDRHNTCFATRVHYCHLNRVLVEWSTSSQSSCQSYPGKHQSM